MSGGTGPVEIAQRFSAARDTLLGDQSKIVPAHEEPLAPHPRFLVAVLQRQDVDQPEREQVKGIIRGW